MSEFYNLEVKKKMTKMLTEQEGRHLLSIARQSILHGLGMAEHPRVHMKPTASDVILNENRGAFVSLHKKGELRGCIGIIEPEKTIFDAVTDNAKHAAFNDTRFNPLRSDELDDTLIEVSILTRPERLNYSDPTDLVLKLEPGIHGVVLSNGNNKATFLPQVWQQLDSSEVFLDHLCLKAGLPRDKWQTGELDFFVYQVQSFEDPV